MKDQLRQGDVLLKPIGCIPNGAKHVEINDARIVLAFGEVTGHAHTIHDVDSCDVYETAEQRILKVTGREMRAIRCRNTKNDGICLIPEGADVSKYPNLESVCVETVHGVLLVHEEHNPFVITAGTYVAGGSGKKHTQREYSPEAIRNVMD